VKIPALSQVKENDEALGRLQHESGGLFKIQLVRAKLLLECFARRRVVKGDPGSLSESERWPASPEIRLPFRAGAVSQPKRIFSGSMHRRRRV